MTTTKLQDMQLSAEICDAVQLSTFTEETYEKKGQAKITVDDELSLTSENPVQNNILTEMIELLQIRVEDKVKRQYLNKQLGEFDSIAVNADGSRICLGSTDGFYTSTDSLATIKTCTYPNDKYIAPHMYIGKQQYRAICYVPKYNAWLTTPMCTPFSSDITNKPAGHALRIFYSQSGVDWHLIYQNMGADAPELAGYTYKIIYDEVSEMVLLPRGKYIFYSNDLIHWNIFETNEGGFSTIVKIADGKYICWNRGDSPTQISTTLITTSNSGFNSEYLGAIPAQIVQAMEAGSQEPYSATAYNGNSYCGYQGSSKGSILKYDTKLNQYSIVASNLESYPRGVITVGNYIYFTMYNGSLVKVNGDTDEYEIIATGLENAVKLEAGYINESGVYIVGRTSKATDLVPKNTGKIYKLDVETDQLTELNYNPKRDKITVSPELAELELLDAKADTPSIIAKINQIISLLKD